MRDIAEMQKLIFFQFLNNDVEAIHWLSKVKPWKLLNQKFVKSSTVGNGFEANLSRKTNFLVV